MGFEALGRRLCHEGVDGITTELTEEDLEKRGADLGASTSIAGPHTGALMGLPPLSRRSDAPWETVEERETRPARWEVGLPAGPVD